MSNAHAEQIVAEDVVLEPLESQDLAERIASLCWDVKALDVQVLRVRELVQYTDWFVIASGRSDRQVMAIRDHIEEALRDEGDVKPYSTEGTEHNQWVVLDYSDVVVHLFFEPVRDYYQLEKLWGEATKLQLKPPEDLAIHADPYA